MMNEGGVRMGEKEPLLPRWAKVLLIILGLLIFGVGGTWLVLDITTRDALEAELAQVRAKGWPTEAEDLYPESIPASENAALVYGQAFASFQGTEEDWSLIWGITSPEDLEALTDEQRTQLEACLGKNAPALELLHQAAQMKQCQFDLDYRMGPVMLTPHTEPLREAVRLERTAMLVSLKAGKSEQAFERWLDSLRTVRHQEGQKVLMCELSRLACLSICLDALEALVGNGELTEAQLSRALDALQGIEGRGSFAEGLKGELASFRQLFRLGIEQAFLPGRGSRAPEYRLKKLVLRPLFQHDEATGIRLLSQLIDLSMEPRYHVRQQLGQWYGSLSARPWLTPLSAMLLPAWSKSLDSFAYAEASAACARTGLALELYRLRHGHYPDALTDLAPDLLPEVPLDPFDGQPVRYIRSPERVAVYSVGLDLQDDSGSEEEGVWGRPRDIVFTLRQAPTPTEEAGDE